MSGTGNPANDTPEERSIAAYKDKFGTLPTLIGLNTKQFEEAIGLLDEAVKYGVEYSNDKEFYEALGITPPGKDEWV